MLALDRLPDADTRARTLGATWASLAFHGGVAILIAVVAGSTRVGDPQIPSRIHPLLVWMEGPGGRSSDGRWGDQTPGSPRQAERRGADQRTIPARVAPSFEGAVTRDPPAQEISIPAVPEASGLREVPGVITTVSSIVTLGLGPGTDRGAGDTDGSGLNRGPGTDTGVGDGPAGPGSGVSSPQLVRQVRPNYTTAAMHARISGIVMMDAVVLPDGSVGDVKIVRSLGRAFGLDEEAIKAVKQWRFRPGRRGGTPVAMWVRVEMVFELR
jgi:TonB family protein